MLLYNLHMQRLEVNCWWFEWCRKMRASYVSSTPHTILVRPTHCLLPPHLLFSPRLYIFCLPFHMWTE